MTIQKPLTVYKASAGSGKTFTLATEYMKLVIANPQAYRSILAVTFTNKATEEMKRRIISQLYGMSRQLPESDNYMRKIQESLDYSREQVAQRAGEALTNLLHHYSYFRVETIDSFFQRVMRNLAKELELTANLRIDLNETQIEQQAVDALIESLSVGDKLLAWILDYVRHNITEDKNWNVIGKIKDFGKNIFKDFYKSSEKALNDKLGEEGFIEQYSQRMNSIKDEVDEQIQQIAATFFDTLDENGLTEEDFARKKSGVWGYFNKLRTGDCYVKDMVNTYVRAAIEAPEGWFTKANATPRNPAFHVVTDTLFPLLTFSEEKLPKLLLLYKSADVTLSHLSQLRLLDSIDKKVREMNQETNRFLLSDTQSLLQSLINQGANDTPFIFEKIGTQLEHIMIDEFQDTSTTQWKNFKVLLEETMSHEQSGNLIVGDVKQSIYRWRAGDWKLLNDIEREFENAQDRLQVESLAWNYRSERNVVEFNNRFFLTAIDWEYQAQKDENPTGAEMLKQAYADVEQQIPENKPKHGYVRVHLLPNEDYREAMTRKTVETVDELLGQGYAEKQIAILVRGNETIRHIADYFLTYRPQYQLVSDEAFRLDASSAVNTLVMAMKLLLYEDNIIQEALKNYCHKLIDDADGKETLPSEYVEHKKELLELPLLDMVEQLARIFHIHELQGQSAYVCAFYDQLSKYLQDGTANIEDFLEEWDENLHAKTIQSDDVEGIRLMTIHKSKGLEFDNIIIPFCDWQLEKSYVIWCTPQEEPFNQLPLVPVDYSKTRLSGTIYEKEYQHEHLQNIVDNMNLLYVAFTRARQNLFVYGKRDASRTRSFVIQQSLDEIAGHLKDATLAGQDAEKTEPFTFEYGVLNIATRHEDKPESQNIFLKSASRLRIEAQSYPVKTVFRQSNKSRDFIEGDDDDTSTQDDYVRIGILLHQIFSSIRTTEDIDGALKQLELEGVLYGGNINEEKLQSLLRQRLESPGVREWFSNKWTLYNECDILSVNAETNTVETHRPDRVITDGNKIIVIDFKFASPREEHHLQVQGYINLLRQMGHEDVKGYLWYVYPNKIIEV